MRWTGRIRPQFFVIYAGNGTEYLSLTCALKNRIDLEMNPTRYRGGNILENSQRGAGENASDRVVLPAEVGFGDNRVQALFAVLVVFGFQLRGFDNREMRSRPVQLPAFDPATIIPSEG